MNFTVTTHLPHNEGMDLPVAPHLDESREAWIAYLGELQRHPVQDAAVTDAIVFAIRWIERRASAGDETRVLPLLAPHGRAARDNGASSPR